LRLSAGAARLVPEDVVCGLNGGQRWLERVRNDSCERVV
jgi:hypothetical protein